ncbi:ABC transporter ATP-binding protein [Paenarthrobacter nitroguajacolicus]|uniref:ABC transporter ATP-binding protein n=1 Tax=Paenarthrobacter nitroguajacolicus TaxID=211146 RepID=UPI001FB97B9E|nr:ABC transporter ATP-binding protein [Paenarthrobacter nitroguajacolicus]
MAQKIARDAKSGEFVRMAVAARRPSTTTVEFVGSGTNNSRTVNRSADSGRFVTAAAAKRNPGGTIKQKV